MAVLKYRGPMESLGVAARFTIVLPERMIPEAGKKFPVLWLLSEEGKLSDDYLRRGGLEALAEQYGIAIVCPEGLHSDYEDMLRGMRWYTYISEGLPKYLRENFPLSEKEQDNFVFGFGMGGLGSVRLGLRKPDFAAVFGACNADLQPFSEDEAHSTTEYVHKMQTIYGDDWCSIQVLGMSDPARLLKKAETIPEMYLYASADGPYRMGMQEFCGGLGAELRVLENGSESLIFSVLSDFLSHTSG